MVIAHGLDSQRVYVTGLSAGGAMAAALLATYPDAFAGGAIIAGLPYGAAASVKEALAAMSHCHSLPARDWGDLVRNASPAPRRRPTVAIWHGDADTPPSHPATRWKAPSNGRMCMACAKPTGWRTGLTASRTGPGEITRGR